MCNLCEFNGIHKIRANRFETAKNAGNGGCKYFNLRVKGLWRDGNIFVRCENDILGTSVCVFISCWYLDT